jgi:hypothetical protein
MLHTHRNCAIANAEDFDTSKDVFVVLVHDELFVGVAGLFPVSLNELQTNSDKTSSLNEDIRLGALTWERQNTTRSLG